MPTGDTCEEEKMSCKSFKSCLDNDNFKIRTHSCGCEQTTTPQPTNIS